MERHDRKKRKFLSGGGVSTSVKLCLPGSKGEREKPKKHENYQNGKGEKGSQKPSLTPPTT